MILNAVLLIGLGILCLLLTIVGVIFTAISFGNNNPNKFVWLTVFFCSLTGLIICVVLFVKKAVNAAGNFTENTIGRFENYTDSLSAYMDSTSINRHQTTGSNEQIKLLKSYLASNVLNNEPEEFYTYLGFQNYYRLPLRFPYSIHCTDVRDNGELYNEVNVSRFDENDNGEIYASISNIAKIAFDKNYLLIEQSVSSTRTDKLITHYILYSFETDKKEETSSLSKLLQLAKEKGYTGSDTLMTLEQYHSLF